jgi:hypothetical protein
MLDRFVNVFRQRGHGCAGRGFSRRCDDILAVQGAASDAGVDSTTSGKTLLPEGGGDNGSVAGNLC